MSIDNSDSESYKLILAANNGDAAGVEAALRAGADMEAVDPQCRNYTALHWSTERGHRNVVIKLLNAGVNVDDRDDKDRSAFHIACYKGYIHIALLLIGKGAQIETIDKKGCSPLISACRKGHNNIVELLLETGANIELRDNFGRKPIQHAAYFGHYLTMTTLIQFGADVNCTTNECLGPLLLAAQRGHDEVVKLLIENRAQLNLTDSDGMTALNMASYQGHTAIACALITHKADVNIADSVGFTPLINAIENNMDEVVSLLIEHGANIETVTNDEYGLNALMVACGEGHSRCSTLLIKGGADLNNKSKTTCSPLGIASLRGHATIVEQLLRNGAEKHIVTIGMQATHLAANNGHLNVLEILKEFECDLNAISEKKQNTPLHLAVKKNQIDIAKWLIPNGANPYACNIKGETAIQIALKNGHPELASFMTTKNIYSTSPSTSTETSKLECAVCLEHRTTTVMTLPCRHAKTCQNCSDDMAARADNHCPICRTKITQRIPIFL